MKFLSYGILLLMLSTLTTSCKQEKSCASKEDLLQSIEVFISEYDQANAGSEGSVLSAEAKAVHDGKFRSLINDCYKKLKPEMSLEERQQFWKNSLKYVVKSIDITTKEDLTSKLDDPFNAYVKDEVVQLMRESGIGFMMSLQELFKDDLPRLMDMFSDEIEKIGKEFLENMFN